MQQTPDLHPVLNDTSPTDLTHIFLKAIALAIIFPIYDKFHRINIFASLIQKYKWKIQA
jgi:hypothetical protein